MRFSLSVGISINNVGIVAGVANSVNDLATAAFRFDRTQSPTQTSLGSLGGVVMASKSINAAGDIVGFAANAESRGTTFLYENGQLSDLGNVLGFPGMQGSYLLRPVTTR